MSKRIRAVAGSALAVAIAAASISQANASAYTAKYITSITYQNVGIGTAAITLNFYSQESGTPIVKTLQALNANAGTSINIGSIDDTSISTGFKGAAVMSSDQPIVATMVQYSGNDATVRNRALSNGFGADGGSSSFLIATVLKATFGSTTQFSIQNVDSVGNDLTVKFINADPAAGAIGATTATAIVTNLPANSVKYYDAGIVAGLPATFNGSVQITAVRNGTTTPGKVVATALELNTDGVGVSAFEGVAGGSPTVYMPSALCNVFGGQSSAYAVQNTNAPGGAAANVTLTYSVRPAGSTGAFTTYTETASIAAGAKYSFRGCGTGAAGTGFPANNSGSAKITATGGNIVAVAKVFGAGLSTATPGVSVGSPKLALPYVRYSESKFDSGVRQRTFLAIQNVGTTDLAAGAVTVKYLDRSGNVVGTPHVLGAMPVNSKLNSNPRNSGAGTEEFGYYEAPTPGFGGSAIIEGPAGSQLVAVARVTSAGVGEDYNGIPIN